MNPMVVSCGNLPHPTQPKSCHMTISAGQAMITMCPRGESQLTYMIPIAVTAEFCLDGDGVL